MSQPTPEFLASEALFEQIGRATELTEFPSDPQRAPAGINGASS